MTGAPGPADYRSVWMAKPALRAVYRDAYRRMAAALRPGRTLEVGGGAGNFKEFAPDVIATDIQRAPWLDAVCDAHALPFAVGAFQNVVGFDVLHHLERPAMFFDSAARVLRPGGRIVLVEPAITPLSWPVYRFLHPEPVRLGDDPLAEGPRHPGRDPYAANQAIPDLIFRRGRGRDRFARRFPDLALISVTLFGLFAYPLSGGFRRWSLIPAALVPLGLRIEERLAPLLGPLMAFRLLAVVERT